eukprot:scaffold150699_cov13-Tisochrysis_lutea.AAC.1
MPAKMGSPGSCLPACLIGSDGWALHQEHAMGCLEGWGGVQKSAPCTPSLARKLVQMHEFVKWAYAQAGCPEPDVP